MAHNGKKDIDAESAMIILQSIGGQAAEAMMACIEKIAEAVSLVTEDEKARGNLSPDNRQRFAAGRRGKYQRPPRSIVK